MEKTICPNCKSINYTASPQALSPCWNCRTKFGNNVVVVDKPKKKGRFSACDLGVNVYVRGAHVCGQVLAVSSDRNEVRVVCPKPSFISGSLEYGFDDYYSPCNIITFRGDEIALLHRMNQ